MSRFLEELGVPDGYIPGLVRDYPHPKLSHLYKGDFSDPGLPMCRYGWNRKEFGYSIWRNNIGEKGYLQDMPKARSGWARWSQKHV